MPRWAASGWIAVREGLAAVPLAAHAARGLPGQVVPDPRGFFVFKPVFAVAHVAVGQALHEGPIARPARAGAESESPAPRSLA